ncbi:unnamed protein product [Moneuplotes crassus]|uniref:Homeobox domain-containing protein n=1 Tax=Euplotes crassus TaxID=5936 RepID=A0AAD1XKW0_EUPCR|nr:unnamed protein product [Moneuplotes crassus]
MRQDAKKNDNLQRKSRAKSSSFNDGGMEVLKEWLESNLDYPYIERSDILKIQAKTTLTKKQIQGWCTNIRRRRMTVIRDSNGNKKLVPHENPEKKRQQNKQGERVPIILLNDSNKTIENAPKRDEDISKDSASLKSAKDDKNDHHCHPILIEQPKTKGTIKSSKKTPQQFLITRKNSATFKGSLSTRELSKILCRYCFCENLHYLPLLLTISEIR